jgi:hypothetical protein
VEGVYREKFFFSIYKVIFVCVSSKLSFPLLDVPDRVFKA